MKMKPILIILLLCLIPGCTGFQCAPDMANYKDANLAFMLADCTYRNRENPIACVKLAERYAERDVAKEQREVLSFCKDPANYPEGWDNEKCRMFLKQRN